MWKTLSTVAKSAVFATAISLQSGPCPADAVPKLTADDYARAERFLPWNEDRYVINGDIQHHWIGTEDRFWYSRITAADDKEFVIVDAVTGKQSPGFDPQKIAASPPKLAGEVPSPDGKWIAFTRGHNLWLRSAKDGKELPLTTDGAERYHYAYVPIDPVTQERRPAEKKLDLAWSTDSNYILTSRTDERRVKDLYLIQSNPEGAAARPRLYAYPLAVPGDEHLTEVLPVLIDIKAKRQKAFEMPPLVNIWPNGAIRSPGYAWWAKNGANVYFLKRDRFGKTVSVNALDIKNMRTRELFRETSGTFVKAGWGEGLELIRTLKNGDVIWYSDRDGWGHLYYYDGVTGKLRNRITEGRWVVRSIVRIDERNRRIYFMASGRETGRDPYQRYLYVCNLDGSRLRLLTPEEGDHSVASDGSADDYSEQAGLSPSGRYFIDSYSNPTSPPVLVLRAADGRIVKQLEKADISKLRDGGYQPVEPFQVTAADGKTSIFGNLFRPSNFDAGKKYPVIDANYPGPHMIRTGKSFGLTLFHPFEAQSLAELGFIVVTIDGRGTPYRSREFSDYAYGQLSRASDLEDHIAGIRQLGRRYPFMDLSRIGIDGVSQGGFEAARGVLAYPDFYKVAVSAAGPHDNGRYSIAWWVETYNGPVDQGNYRDSNNRPLASNLKGKLLLMHGELDDRTSPSHTLMLVDALIEANKDFDLLIMPNQNHDAFLTPYFIRKKWDYFVRNLLGAEPPAGYRIAKPQ